jgi:acyl-CoA synthetase (AMP-forming)/AMP-acid ligase II
VAGPEPGLRLLQIVKYDEGDGEGDERRPSSAVSLPEKEIGEIWINSASKASGYWSGTSVLAAQQEVGPTNPPSSP